jgi:hypothetical protein
MPPQPARNNSLQPPTSGFATYRIPKLSRPPKLARFSSLQPPALQHPALLLSHCNSRKVIRINGIPHKTLHPTGGTPLLSDNHNSSIAVCLTSLESHPYAMPRTKCHRMISLRKNQGVGGGAAGRYSEPLFPLHRSAGCGRSAQAAHSTPAFHNLSSPLSACISSQNGMY